jgi:hypothetical protein
MKILLIPIVAFSFYTMSAFSIDVAGYLELRSKDDSYSSLALESYMRGLVDGTLAVDALARYQNQETKGFNSSFCPPDTVKFDTDMARKHIDAYIRHAEAISALDKSADVGLLFVTQLNKTYPCK